MVSNAHKESFVVIQNRKMYISCYEHFQGLKRQDYLHQWSKESEVRALFPHFYKSFEYLMTLSHAFHFIRYF